MSRFYKKAAGVFLGLVVMTILLALACSKRVFIIDVLFPAYESVIPWHLETVTNVRNGGSSAVYITEDIYSLGYQYLLPADMRFPYLMAVVAFGQLKNAEKLIDLRKYSAATFRVKCAPSNVLNFYVHSFDKNVTDPADFYSYRIAEALFSCQEEWTNVDINLRHLKVPVWWLEMSKVKVSDQGYSLDKVIAISFNASFQGPINVPATVKIAELTLRGRDWRYAWIFAGVSAVVWVGFIGWFFKQYTASLIMHVKDKLRKNRPLIAYQQLSLEPHRDKEKSQLLRFMATEYRNPGMSLEFAVATLGINRAKINAFLKDELGMTFNSYLNKLRLAEAARLLSQKDNANVAEIAHLVGHTNVSYFIRLFKNEYGCTPGTFIGLRESRKAE